MLFAIVNGQAQNENEKYAKNSLKWRFVKIRKIKSEKEMLNINLKRKRTINQMMK